MEDLPDRILTETYARLLAGTVSRTHIDHIATALHISKKTLYQHFPSKSALLQAVFTRYQQRAKARHRTFRTATTATDELGLLLRWFSGYYQLKFIVEVGKFAPRPYQTWRQYLIDLIENNLQRGQVEGAYRTALDTQIISRLHIGQMELLARALAELASFSPNRLHRALREHFLRSIRKVGSLN